MHKLDPPSCHRWVIHSSIIAISDFSTFEILPGVRLRLLQIISDERIFEHRQCTVEIK